MTALARWLRLPVWCVLVAWCATRPLRAQVPAQSGAPIVEVRLDPWRPELAVLEDRLRAVLDDHEVRVVRGGGATHGDVLETGSPPAHVRVDAGADDRVTITVFAGDTAAYERHVESHASGLDEATCEAAAAIVASAVEALHSQQSGPFAEAATSPSPAAPPGPISPGASDLPAPRVAPGARPVGRGRAQPSPPHVVEREPDPSRSRPAATAASPSTASMTKTTRPASVDTPPSVRSQLGRPKPRPRVEATVAYAPSRWARSLWLHGLDLDLLVKGRASPFGVRWGAWLTPTSTTTSGPVIPLSLSAYGTRLLLDFRLAVTDWLHLDLASGGAAYLLRSRSVRVTMDVEARAPDLRVSLVWRSELAWVFALHPRVLARVAAGLDVARGRIAYGVQYQDGFLESHALERARVFLAAGLGAHF